MPSKKTFIFPTCYPSMTQNHKKYAGDVSYKAYQCHVVLIHNLKKNDLLVSFLNTKVKYKKMHVLMHEKKTNCNI